MTGDGVVVLAQARVKNTNTAGYDWDTFFTIVVNEIFSKKAFKFARQQINYIHPQSVFEKTFDDGALEKALKTITTLRYTSSYTLFDDIPLPVSNSARELEFKPLQEFMFEYPDQITEGEPYCYTELHRGDGVTNGMQIGLYPVPVSDVAVWIDGDFVPVINNDNQPIVVLPIEFHPMLVFGLSWLAAGQAGQPAKAKEERAIFDMWMAQLVAFDARAPKHKLYRKSISESVREGPFFPTNFPKPYAR